MLIRQLRHKIVLRRAGEVHQSLIRTVRAGIPGIPGHHIGIHIHGINRVRHGDPVARPENVQNVARIALGAVRHVNLIHFHMHAVDLVGLFGDSLPQPEIALLRTIAVKALMGGQIVHRLVHGFNGRHGQRFRHVSDAAADQPFGRLRMGLGKRIHAAPYFREQISRLQLEEVIVNIRHGFNSKCLIPYPPREGIKAPFRHGSPPCVTISAHPFSCGSLRADMEPLPICVSCSASNSCLPG